MVDSFAPVTLKETFGTKLRRLARQAAISNPVDNPPLTAPPAWVGSTAYLAGQAVSNSGQWYICYLAGTSAGSGGPSGTGAGPITDGTVTWYWMCSPKIAANDIGAPAFSFALTSYAAAGVPNIYQALNSLSSFYFKGGAPTQSTALTQYIDFPSVSTVSGGLISGGKSNWGWSAEFYTDAPKFAIGHNNNNGPSRTIIDGRYYSLGGDCYGGGGPGLKVYDFSSVGGRKVRRVQFEAYGNYLFHGVGVDAQSKVWPTETQDRIRVAVLGSSIESGGNSFPILSAGSWVEQVGKLLGGWDVRNLGLGGTGYIAPNNSSSQYNYGQHFSDVIAANPDILIIGGPENDASYGATAITVACANLLSMARAALPNTLIIVIGAYPSSSGPDASHIAAENAVASAVSAFRDANTFFVPNCTDPTGSWITGTGKVTATTGTGNADVCISSDGTHPIQGGIDYFAKRMATALRTYALPYIV